MGEAVYAWTGLNTQMNAIRYQALELLEDRGVLTAATLAELTDRSPKAASMLLMRARRDGLVRYRRVTGQHALSKRGRARLAWLRGEAP